MAKKVGILPEKTRKTAAKTTNKTATKSIAPVTAPVKKIKPAKKSTAGTESKAVAVKAKKKARVPHATRPTPGEEIKILERQNLVMDLKIAGTSFRKIHKRLLDLNYEVSLGTVHADYVASLGRLQATNITATELLVEQELAKIEDWEFELTMASKGKPLTPFERAAINQSFIALQNQRDKFLAISKPKVIRFETDEEFARALGLIKEELPNGDQSED